ncbi:hypothetical protein ZIOFF_040186 [Zingiber officinale]|uniref:Uncharacterized protein n=1 Tax=Zingiber officinale TaxID=94328 RepID=A0A8J5GH61_ZINOF|nr:hypothetical protein ZIOFF_040186 [Zingiber officinale]
MELNLSNVDYKHTVQGEILSPLLNLTRLEWLDLSGNDFEGTPIPHFIGSFHKLKYLELYGSNFSGVIPSQLGNLSSLYHLGLQSTLDAASIAHRLDWLSDLSSLSFLDLNYVNLSTVSQSWLSEVNMLPSLRELYLEECDLNNIPSSFSSHLNLTSLVLLDLGFNDFYSTIPNWLWNLTKLSALDFYESSLFGPIPIEIGTLSRLRKLYLDNTIDLASCIVGPRFPQWLRSQKSMIELSLSNTSIEDNVPNWFWNISSTTIDLSHNKLSGTLPLSLEGMPTLELLVLSFNKLEGVVPSWPPQIMMLDLSFNNFSALPSKGLGFIVDTVLRVEEETTARFKRGRLSVHFGSAADRSSLLPRCCHLAGAAASALCAVGCTFDAAPTERP